MAEKYELNPTLNPLDAAERQQINQNWTRIKSYFDNLHSQLNHLAGDKEVDDLLAAIESATQAAIEAEELALGATIDAETATNNTLNVISTANDAAANANNKAGLAQDKIDFIEAHEENIEYFTSMQTSLQTQINQLVVDGDSSPEAAAARVSTNSTGGTTTFPTLKQRLDTEKGDITAQLAQTALKSEVSTLATEKVDKVTGKGLSTNDYTVDDKTLVAQVPQLAKKVEVEAEMLQRATIEYVDAKTNAMASGTPKLIKSTVAQLPTTVGTNDEKLALVTANNHKYWWDGSAWVDGGLYETATVADGSVDTFKLQNGLAKAFNIFPHWSDFTNQTLNTTVGAQAVFTYSTTSQRVNHIDITNGAQNLVSKKVAVQSGSTLYIHNESVFKMYLLEINAENQIVKVSSFLTNGQKYALQSVTTKVQFLVRRSDDVAYSINELKLADIVITTDTLIASIENKIILNDTKNLISQFPPNWEIGARSATVGEPSVINTSSTRLRYKEIINVTPNTYYTIKMHNEDMKFSFVHLTDEDKVIQNPVMVSGTFTFRTSALTTKLWLVIGHNDNRAMTVDDVKSMRLKFEKNTEASLFTLSESDIYQLISNTTQAVESYNLFAVNKVYHAGHRGSGINSGVPENTIPSILKAGELGYWGAELDLRVTSDGEIVIIHDETVDRTTNGTGNIADKTLAQAKALNIDTHNEYTNLKIPTFDEALVACKQAGVIPILHVGSSISGSSTLITKMCETLANRKFAKTAVILSDKSAMMSTIKGILPDIHLQLMLSSSTDTTRINLAKTLKGSVSINFTLIPNATWVKSLQDEGLVVATWVVDTPINYQMLLNYGVDMMSFDNKIW